PVPLARLGRRGRNVAAFLQLRQHGIDRPIAHLCPWPDHIVDDLHEQVAVRGLMYQQAEDDQLVHARPSTSPASTVRLDMSFRLIREYTEGEGIVKGLRGYLRVCSENKLWVRPPETDARPSL